MRPCAARTPMWGTSVQEQGDRFENARSTMSRAFVLGMNETGLTAARCLGKEGISVRGFDIGAGRAGFRSRYCTAEICPDPLQQPDQLVRFMRHQAGDRSETIVLLPTSHLYFLF